MSGHEISTLPRQAEAFQGHLAGLVSRSLAATIDLLVVASVMMAGYAALCAVRFAWNPRTFSFPAPSGWFTMAAAGVVTTVYLTVGWWVAGRTYGCAVMGLRVVGSDDQDVRLAPGLLRAAACVLFPLGLGWCLLDRRARSVQDLLAHTRVIYDWRHRER